jgi:ribonuclease BN (tRNA processing enzyme)
MGRLRMKVIFLGTNGWFDTETGNTICTLILADEYDIILDAGNGIHRADGYISGDKPVFLFLSHFHLDHIEGFHVLGRFRFHQGLTLCGPTGSRQILGSFINRPFTIPLAELPYPARILEMPAEAASLPFSVEPMALRHASFTLGYRISLDGRTVGYCPDTGYCENAVRLGRAADLLITECAFKQGQANEQWPHLNPETAAGIAREAGARRLVLTHFDAGNYRSLAEREASRQVAASIFPATTAGTDNLEINL